MRYAHRPNALSPADRLPVELQDGIGFRFLSQLPSGPMRDSVEGYLAMPPGKRGTGTLAYKIVVASVRAEQERQRASRGTLGRFIDLAKQNVDEAQQNSDVARNGDADEPPVLASPLDAIPPSTVNEPDGRVRFEFDDETRGGPPPDRSEVRVPSGSGERPDADPQPVTWRRPRVEPDGGPGDPPPIAAESPHGGAEPRIELADDPVGWSTGFAELDAWGLRWVPGNLYLVHGPPGGGRTAFLLELLRRYAEGQGGAVYVSGRERRSDLYVRLMEREIARNHGTSSPDALPLNVTVRAWLRDPTSVPHHLADIMAGAAQRLDDLATHGGMELREGPSDGASFGAWASALAHRTSSQGPSLVILDDAAAPEIVRSSADGDQAHLARIVRRLERIARGGGPDLRVPVVFSLPFPPAGPALARLGGVLRVDAVTGQGGPQVVVERNVLGPRGGTFELETSGRSDAS
jgi:hypothetical protein